MINTIFKSFIFLSLMVFISVPLSYAQATEGDEAVRALADESGRELVDELLFDNIASLAGSSCSLYAAGIDLVNLAYDGKWTFQDSILEIAVLFRNEPWREISWAVSDQREEYAKELVSLEKQRCLLGFAKPEAQFDQQEQKRLQQVADVQRKIIELEEKINYFSIQRRNLLYDKPHFGGQQSDAGEKFDLPEIPVDKIFYSLGGFTTIDVNWEQFVQSSNRVVMDTREDLAVITRNIPNDCFAIVTVGHELDYYFASKFKYQNGMYRDAQGREYESFKAFVDDNGEKIVEQYTKKYCSESRARALADAEKTGAKKQYQLFQSTLKKTIDIVSKQLQSVNRQVTALEKQKIEGGEVSQESLEELYRFRGRLIAMREYHSLVLKKVPSPESQSVDKLAKSLEDFTSAVLGVVSDNNDKKKSRISFAERYKNAEERNLKKICARIEAMYREAGRSTADLPVIGVANGREYCRAKPACADVGLGNLVGASEGRKKLAECSGFLFDQSELGPSQLTKDVIKSTSEDIGILLQQRSLNDLLKQRNLHFNSLRGRYKSLYGAQSDTTTAVEQMIKDTALNLFNPKFEEVYDPDGDEDKTHFALMQKIYRDFKKFIDKQEGSCSAPDKPKT
jgi:hypothetical protein